MKFFVAIRFDFGTLTVLPILLVILISTITFPYLKRNRFFGIRTRKSYESEAMWHKIHVLAALFTIPFDLLFFAYLWIDDAALKLAVAFVTVFLLTAVYTIIQNEVTRKYFSEKKALEAKELEAQIKKESGWR